MTDDELRRLASAADDDVRVSRARRRLHEGSEGWRAGIEASLAKVRYRQSVMPDLQKPAYAAALADVALHLEAMLERGTEHSTCVVADIATATAPTPTRAK